jgi:hypothetical protein
MQKWQAFTADAMVIAEVAQPMEAGKLLSNDSGSSPIVIWHAGSRLSE